MPEPHSDLEEAKKVLGVMVVIMAGGGGDG